MSGWMHILASAGKEFKGPEAPEILVSCIDGPGCSWIAQWSKEGREVYVSITRKDAKIEARAKAKGRAAAAREAIALLLKYLPDGDETWARLEEDCGELLRDIEAVGPHPGSTSDWR